MHWCDGRIQNNTLVGNTAGENGDELSVCHGTILNCIVWPAVGGRELYKCSVPTYSCVRGWDQGGDGNFNYDPHFVDPEKGDYHLSTWSPCIDSGDPASPFSQEPEPNGGRVNMGAYGNTPEAESKSVDTDADGLPDDWELSWFRNLGQIADGDFDCDAISNISEYRWGTDPVGTVDARVENKTDGCWYPTIERAILECNNRDEVVVHPGSYTERIVFGGRNVVLRSVDPADPDTVADTVIDSGGNGSVVTFSGTESESCVLSGFTIQNGSADFGGGICGGTEDTHTRAVIQNNIVIQNSADSAGGGLAYCDGMIENNEVVANRASQGGGLYGCDGVIHGNEIVENSASSGGGMAECNGIIRDNNISGNSASRDFSRQGGAVYRCDGLIEGNWILGNSSRGDAGGIGSCYGTVRKNVIAKNTASGDGGALAYCDGPIENNIIVGNSAHWSGGGLDSCDGIIRNNLVSRNTAGVYGGGLSDCGGTIHGNTVAHNTADSSCGGLFYCDGPIQNCIVWGNMDPNGWQVCASEIPDVSYSCVQGWPFGGEGNTTAAPRFLDPDGPDDDPATYEDNDYCLSLGSPCIDTGKNENWMWDAVDLSGNPRIWMGTVDMGCYEYGSWPFEIVEISDGAGLRQITWNSRLGDTYTIWSCPELLSGEWVAEATIPSAGETTDWIDPDALSMHKFYRIELK